MREQPLLEGGAGPDAEADAIRAAARVAVPCPRPANLLRPRMWKVRKHPRKHLPNRRSTQPKNTRNMPSMLPVLNMKSAASNTGMRSATDAVNAVNVLNGDNRRNHRSITKRPPSRMPSSRSIASSRN